LWLIRQEAPGIAAPARWTCPYTIENGQGSEDANEMTDHAFADYGGGTPEERAQRDLLRQVMEKQDFKVNDKEWWHFDYQDWKQYPIPNVKFEDLAR